MPIAIESYHAQDPNSRRSSRTMVNEEDQPEYEVQSIQRKRAKTHEKLQHTASCFEAIGFNENASMYQYGYRHDDRQHSVDDPARPASRHRSRTNTNEKKRPMSFIKKLVGANKDGK